ncbi:MAG: DUF6097 family protein [Sporomusaceae bacterium]|nr:DUF6097 family protein [Sporomusaceae bacterium]
MNPGRILAEALEFSQELDDLHKHISATNLPVKKSDSFDKQCLLLEDYLGGNAFRTYHKKMKTANMLSGVLAAPVLVAIVVFILIDKFNSDFNVFKFILDNPVIYILAGILLVAVLSVAWYFRHVKNKLYGEIYPAMKDRLNM